MFLGRIYNVYLSVFYGLKKRH